MHDAQNELMHYSKYYDPDKEHEEYVEESGGLKDGSFKYQTYDGPYASPYYDPEKAHEYYEAHKQLVGKRSSSKLSDEGKELWYYTKEQIKEEKKQRIAEEKEARDAYLTEMREKATETRERISAKLKELSTALTEQSKAMRENIKNEKDQKIEDLKSNELPKNMPRRKRARLVAQRQMKIAKLRADASESSSQITERTSAERKSNSASAKVDRENVSSALKDVIGAIREAYKASKTDIDAEYEEIYQEEYDKILAQYPWVSKKKQKSAKGGSGKVSEKKKKVRQRSGSYTRNEMSGYLGG